MGSLLPSLLTKGGIEGVQHGRHGGEDLVIVRAGRPHPRENRFESSRLGHWNPAHVQRMHEDTKTG